MQVEFGWAQDIPHIAPDTPGGYEWWYFDALSHDGRFALVSIFFHGAPMSAYYRRVLQGKPDSARDWCGVFFSLHERVTPGAPWKQRAFAFNVRYGGVFTETGATVGRSAMTMDLGAGDWNLALEETAQWGGRIRGKIAFTADPATSGNPDSLRELSGDADSWDCIAPVATARAEIVLANGQEMAFDGDGYHDHNWGRLPLTDIAIWYWCRSSPILCSDGTVRTILVYHLRKTDPARPNQDEVLVFARGEDTEPREHSATTVQEQTIHTHIYGLRHADVLVLESIGPGGLRGSIQFRDRESLANGPFYRRLSVCFDVKSESWTGQGEGIGEVFCPGVLGGPIVSLATWTRVRRLGR